MATNERARPSLCIRGVFPTTTPLSYSEYTSTYSFLSRLGGQWSACFITFAGDRLVCRRYDGFHRVKNSTRLLSSIHDMLDFWLLSTNVSITYLVLVTIVQPTSSDIIWMIFLCYQLLPPLLMTRSLRQDDGGIRLDNNIPSRQGMERRPCHYISLFGYAVTTTALATLHKQTKIIARYIWGTFDLYERNHTCLRWVHLHTGCSQPIYRKTHRRSCHYGWVQGIQTWGTFSTVWYKIVPHNLSNNEPIASIDTAIIELMWLSISLVVVTFPLHP
jgi:hypothetical protein